MRFLSTHCPRVSAAVVVPLRSLPSSQRLSKRRCLCRATPKISEEERLRREKQLEEVVTSRVEQAASLLDNIIDDIVCDMSIVRSIGYVYEEAAAQTEAEIVKKVVKKYFERLDQNFLASLERFQKKSEDMGHPDVARLIGKIQTEVLSLTNEQFPPEVLLLEDLMKMPDKKDRIAKIKEVAQMLEPKKQTPKTETSMPDSASNPQVYVELNEDASLEDMDLEAELKRLRVLKTESGLSALKAELDQDAARPENQQATSDFDEVMDAVEDPLDDCEPDQKGDIRQEYGKKIDPLQLGLAANQFINDIEEKEEIANRQLLAKLCVIREEARLVEMEMRFAGVVMEDNPLKLRENVPSQVMGIIQMLLKTKDPIKRLGLIRKTFEKDEYGPAAKDLSRAPGYVRPGIFMTALTMTQMEADTRAKQKSTASGIQPGLLQRIDDIRLEAMLVLREMAWGEFSSDELAQQQREREERQKRNKEEFSPKSE